MTAQWSEALDAAARAVFDSVTGRIRLEPLLEAFDRDAGPLLDDDPSRDLLLAVRLDWALCDGLPLDHEDEGDTWLRRALAGMVPGVTPDPAWEPLLATHAGIFEVWPTSDGAFLRDVLRGVSGPLVAPTGLQPAARGPAALWDVRVVLGADGVSLCRAPIHYPLDVLPLLHEGAGRRFEQSRDRIVTIARLRSAWLSVQRQRRLPAKRAFARVLGLPVRA